MRLVKAVLFVLLFIVGVFLASANMESVELVFLPDLPLEGGPGKRSLTLPLFAVALIMLGLGAVVVGAVIGFEQVRLRAGLRRARKQIKKLETELRATEERLELVKTELDQTRRETAERELREPRVHADRADQASARSAAAPQASQARYAPAPQPSPARAQSDAEARAEQAEEAEQESSKAERTPDLS